MDFPITKTKMGDKKFDLTDAVSRREYFEYKAGPEIKKLQEYLKSNTFIAYLLGKKSSGKGTYAKMFKEIINPDMIEHVSIGDMIRSFDEVLKDPVKKQELVDFLHAKYRGPVSVQDIIASMESRSTKMLLPTELILALTEREITKLGRKAIFLDGFPRDFDQVSYSLFFKSLVDYRNDPDLFVLIDVPMQVIDERIKYRVICPKCNTSRNIKLLLTKQVIQKDGKFQLLCDNSSCTGEVMVPKEGDDQGLAPIKSRLDKDGELLKKAYEMHGIPKVLLRSAIPVESVAESFDDYEITPEFTYEVDPKTGAVVMHEKPWQINDDEGVASNSLMPPPVVVALIKQLVTALGI